MKSDGGQSPSRGLTVDEILGNIFVINFDWHDTTANTLAFSVVLLAAYPEYQEWVAGEVQELIKEFKSKEWDYSKLFPRLRDVERCWCVFTNLI